MNPRSESVSVAARCLRTLLFILALTNFTHGVVDRKVACKPFSTTGSKNGVCVCNDGTQPVVRCINVNGMTQIPKDILPRVSSLAIMRAGITELLEGEFEEFDDHLQSLYLSDLKLSSIHGNTFRNLYKLVTLDLKNNALTKLDVMTFQFLTSLTTLDLSGNELVSINKFSFLSIVPVISFTTLKVNLRRNKIRCDCEIYQLKQWIGSFKNTQWNITLNDLSCHNHPEKYRYDQVPNSFYGKCDGVPAVDGLQANCRTCPASSTFYECNTQSRFSCGGTKSRCMKRITYDSDAFDSGTKLTIRTSCDSVSNCANAAYRNKDKCLREGNDLECIYCCTDDICGVSSGSDRTNDYEYILEHITRNGQFSTSLFNSNSREHKQMARIITNALGNINTDLEGGVDYFLERFEPDGNKSYKVLIKVAVTVLNWVEEKDVFTRLRDVFSNKNAPSYFTENANLSKPHAVRRIKNEKCPAEPYNSRPVTSKSEMWPETYAGMTARLLCANATNSKNYAMRQCFMTSITNATWGAVDNSRCWNPNTLSTSTTTTTVTPISLPPDTSSTYNRQEAQKITSDVLKFIEETKSVTSKQLDTMVSLLEKASTSERNLGHEKVSENVLKCVTGLIDVNPVTLKMSQEESKTSSRMLNLIDNVGANAPLTEGKFEFSSPNLAVTARAVSAKETRDVVFSEVKSSDNKIMTQVLLKNGNSGPVDRFSSIVIPTQSVIKTLKESEKQNLKRMTFSIHNDSKLFDSLQQSKTENYIKEDINYLKDQVTGRIISASVPGVTIENLDENITTIFKHNEKNSSNPQCVYWDLSLNGGKGDWTNQGCGVVRSDERSTTCGCNHLTNFALLMDIYQEGGGLSTSDRKALSTISFIGCSISLLSLFLTLFTYSLFRKLRRDTPSKILINLCVALLTSNLIFLVGMQDYTFNSTLACKIVAVLLHYFMLSSLTWMAVEAFYMYLALVLVFKTYFSNFILKLSLFGWGVPAIVVAVTLGVNVTDNYGLHGTGLCWLEIPAFYYAFVGPVCLILLINCIAFGLVIRQLIHMSSAKLNSTDRYSTIQRLRGAIGVIILLGLTWIFAIFAIDSASVPIYYLFTIFNSLQGLFIFIFYCLFKSDALASWKKFLSCCFDQSDLPSSSASKANPKADQRKSSNSSVNYTLSTSSTTVGNNRGNDSTDNNQPSETTNNKSYNYDDIEGDTTNVSVRQMKLQFEGKSKESFTHI